MALTPVTHPASVPVCPEYPNTLSGGAEPPDGRGDGGRGRAGIGRARDGTPDHEQVGTALQGLLGRRDPGLVVGGGTGRPDARRDQRDAGTDLGPDGGDLTRR